MLDSRHLPPHAVAHWAAVSPGSVAVEEVGGASLTYGEFDQAGSTWAAGLAGIGISAGDHVATMLPARIEAQLALLGLAWIGAIEVPINVAHRGDMLSSALNLAEVTAIIVDSALVERVLEVLQHLPLLETIIVMGEPLTEAHVTQRIVNVSDLLDGVEPSRGLAGPRASDVAALLFTSGTTGPSKAVVAPWGLIYSIWSWIPDDALGVNEGLYCSLPMYHNSGRSGFCIAMDRGARFVFRDRFSVTNFWEDVRTTNCSLAALVGPLTSLLWSQEPSTDDIDNPIRGVILGPMIPAMEQFERRFGVQVATCYGQTETGAPLTTGWEHGPWASCGRRRETWPYNEVRIVDSEDRDVAPGEVGELIVRSREPEAMNLGYYGMPEETTAAWRNGWFHSGDALRVDEQGSYYFVDRLHDTIRRRGENISSFEVEAAVSQYPNIVECAAIGIATEHGDDEVMIAIVVDQPKDFDVPSLYRWLEPKLPRFMLPRYIEVFEDLPRNATTHRVRKKELRVRGVTGSTWDVERT